MLQSSFRGTDDDHAVDGIIAAVEKRRLPRHLILSAMLVEREST